jgi:hypothetical protein
VQDGSSSFELTDKRQSNRQAVQRYRQKKKSEFVTLQAENAGLRQRVQDLGSQLEAALSSGPAAPANGQVVISFEEYEELQMLREFKSRVTSSVLRKEIDSDREHREPRGYSHSFNPPAAQRDEAYQHLAAAFRHHRHP